MDYHFFVLTGRPRCKDCGQPEGVKLHVATGGYSVTSGYEHKPDCPQLRCPHGVLWVEDCEKCDLQVLIGVDL